jgi:hypothetical protein
MNFINKIISLFSRLFSEETYYFIIDPEFEGWLLIARNAFLFVSGILLLLLVILLVVSGWIRNRYTEDLYEATSYKPFGVKQSAKEWKRISARIKSGEESDHKLALIEADDLLEERLRAMGYKGGKMQDLLSQVPGTILPNVEEVIRVHQLRNNIVHDPDYKLDPEEASEAISIFERALQELGAV